MEKYFCNYNQSLFLKELGFNEECLRQQYKSKSSSKESKLKELTDDDFINIPLKSQAFEFFREKKMLGEIMPIDSWDSWGYKISLEDAMSPFFIVDTVINEFSTYEETESACIDELIEIAKQNK